MDLLIIRYSFLSDHNKICSPYVEDTPSMQIDHPVSLVTKASQPMMKTD